LGRGKKKLERYVGQGSGYSKMRACSGKRKNGKQKEKGFGGKWRETKSEYVAEKEHGNPKEPKELFNTELGMDDLEKS